MDAKNTKLILDEKLKNAKDAANKFITSVSSSKFGPY